jgi:ABC-type glutathione transport system ATPase component
MEEGRFIEIGPPEQVIGKPREEQTRQFLARFLRGDEDDRRRRRAAEPAEIEGTPGAPPV